MNILFTSSAEQDLKIALKFYEVAVAGLGLKFLEEVQEATALIQSHPLAWTPVSARARRCRIHQFPFGILYQVRPNGILIVAVIDLRRDPKRWEEYL